MTSKKKPKIKPDFEPKLLLTTDQIFNETTKKNEEFIKTSLEIRDEEMKAENEIADEKAKKIIKDIVTPAPGLFINDTFNHQEDISVNKSKNTDNTFRLKTQIQKKLSETALENQKPPILPLPVQPPSYQNMGKDYFQPHPDDDEPAPAPPEQLVYGPQFIPDPIPPPYFEKTSPFPPPPPPPPLPPPYTLQGLKKQFLIRQLMVRHSFQTHCLYLGLLHLLITLYNQLKISLLTMI